MIYIVFGVSGIGKTTIGKMLSCALNIPFYDADDFHPDVNIKKMSDGIPLNDTDRAPWLNLLGGKIKTWNKSSGAVLACSALKESYRGILKTIDNEDVKWIFLNANIELISNRLKSRKNHYFNAKLLQSQFETLEVPRYGLHINANQPKKQIIKQILNNIMVKSSFGIIGLGVMGKSLALNIAGKETSVSVYNRQIPEIEVDIAEKFVNEHIKMPFQGFDKLSYFVLSLEKPRNILLMVNAGKPVDYVIDDLLPFLDVDDLIIDGGNSHFLDTKKRIKRLDDHKIHFIGMGISGGEEGALKGPSMMPSGSKQVYKRIESVLNTISAKDKNGNSCCAYIGPEGSGHFIKMIHNGIEYGEMQILAEIYYLLRFHGEKSPIEIASVFENWKNDDLSSYLLEITIDILRKKEGEDFLIDKILDMALQKGTGGWSTIAALDLGRPFDTISASVMARYMSAMKLTRVKASKLYNSIVKKHVDIDIDKLKSTYKASRIINHAIGFDTIQEASKEYNWNLNLSEIARIWTNGCIIRSSFMEKLVKYFKNSNEHLLLHAEIVEELEASISDYGLIVSQALNGGCTLPVISSGLNYFLGFVSEKSSANMIQAQRDYFGAHTYQRVDKPLDSYFHTQWT